MTTIVQKAPIGTKAPDFQLPNQYDELVSLNKFRGKWLVLFFYPRDNTPSCVRFIKHFSDCIEDFDRYNAKVIGISRNTVKSHINFTEKHSLQITLLSDIHRDAIKKYNAWGVKRSEDAKLVGVKRTTYIVDPSGTIRYRFNAVRIATHAQEVLDLLQQFQQEDSSIQ
jgi:peroxiredoxin Q/BCP